MHGLDRLGVLRDGNRDDRVCPGNHQSGTIAGRVVDPQGAAVPGAMVSARQTDTNVTIEATTDADGRFRFPYLRIGPYELRAQLEGFRENARAADAERGFGIRYPDHARRGRASTRP